MEGIRCDLSSRGAWERLRHATRPLVSESSAVGLFGQANCQKQKQPKAERWVILQRGLLHPRNMELRESTCAKNQGHGIRNPSGFTVRYLHDTCRFWLRWSEIGFKPVTYNHPSGLPAAVGLCAVPIVLILYYKCVRDPLCSESYDIHRWHA